MIKPVVITEWRVEFHYSYGNTIKNVGYCDIRKGEGATVCMHNVHISANHQGRGYGKRMIKQVMSWIKHAKLQGIERVWLDTHNPIALHVYEKCGFKIIKNERDYTKWEMEYKL